VNAPPGRTLLSVAIPGGVLLVAALVLAHLRGLPVTVPPGVNFFACSAGLAGFVLAWRFQSSRVLFGILLLVLTDRALVMLAHASPHSANVGFGLVALVVPANLVLFAVMGECGFTVNALGSGLGIVSVEAIAIAVLTRTENGQFAAWVQRGYFDKHLFTWTPLPQLPLLIFALAFSWLAMRMTVLRKPVDNAYFWTLCAMFAGMQAAAPGRASTLYFGAGMLVLAASLVETSYLLAFHDELTGLPARRAFNQAMLTLADTYSIAMVDVDFFKKFNDTFGHDVGDQVLRMVAGKLAQVGGGGRAYRYGGEEFAIVFPGRTIDQCGPYLDRVRQEIEVSTFMVRGPDRSQRRREERRYTRRGKRATGRQRSEAGVTVSMGVAEHSARLSTSGLVTNAADQALYRAKQNGRNRIEVAVAAARRSAAKDDPVIVR
jgi:diguanylate cyclase (GGDEF)-like protein